MKRLDQCERKLTQLGLASKDAVRLFVTQIAADDVRVRRAASLALRLVGSKDRDSAIPALMRAATDTDDRVRGTAVAALGELGAPPASAVPVIAELLKDDEPNSYVAARALAEMGPSAKPGIPALIDGLSSNYDLTRSSAAHALGTIGHDARPALQALRMAWNDPDPDVRFEAAYAAWKIDGTLDAIGIITPLAQADDLRMALQAIEALGRIGPPAKAAVSVLERLRHGDDKLKAVAAVWAIFEIEQASGLAPKLVQGLNSGDARVRAGSAWALWKTSTRLEAARPRLRTVRDDEHEHMLARWFAAMALARQAGTEPSDRSREAASQKAGITKP